MEEMAQMEEMAHGAPDHAQIYRPATGTWTHTVESRVARLFTVAVQTTDGRHFTQDACVGNGATDKWDSVRRGKRDPPTRLARRTPP